MDRAEAGNGGCVVTHPFLQSYADQGFRLVFWPAIGDSKGPREEGWQRKPYTLTDYKDGYRVGLMTGHEVAPGRFLHDVDIDWAAGSLIAQRMLPSTGFVYGRASKKVSHCFYTCPEPLASFRYEDVDKTCLIELRGTKTNGEIGLQTMVPPSIWTKEGKQEPLTFVAQQHPAHVEAPVLKQRVCLAAIGILLAKHLGLNGFGHEPRLMVAGFLLRAGVDKEDVKAIGRAISPYTNNTEVHDVETSVESTVSALASNQKKVKGGPALAKHIGARGKAVVARIGEWLGHDASLLVLDNAPMNSARTFVDKRYTLDDVRTLHHQSGVFYKYALPAYAEHDEPAVRSELWKFLDEAKVWVKGDEGEKILASYTPNTSKVSNVLDALRGAANLPTTQMPPRWLAGEFSLDPIDVLACPNGLLHIPTRTMHPATPHFFTLNGIDFDYEPQAAVPQRWLDFLAALWPDDAESQEAVQEMFGYMLTPDTRFQKIFLMVGPPRSGKGVQGRILQRLVGERNTCSPTLAAFGRDFGKQVLVGKTLALISDARIGGRTDTASVAETLLSISGEDTQTVERKFLPDWNGKLSTRFLLLTNELPRIGDVSGALAKRFIVLVLKESFYGKEDLGLFDKLVVELPGILNWALEGRDRLYSRGYFQQPASADDLIQEFQDLGSPEATFLKTKTAISPGHSVAQKELFAAWQRWCEENGREHAGTAQSFGRNVRAVLSWITTRQLGPAGAQERHWEGLRLLNPEESADVPF